MSEALLYECQHGTRVTRCADCDRGRGNGRDSALRELVLRIQQEARENTVAALKTYLQHDGLCLTARCDCGLDAILNAVEEES